MNVWNLNASWSGLDNTTGSIDRRAHAELEEITWMNEWNENNQPKNLWEFVDSVRMSEPEINKVSKWIDEMH